MIGKTIDSYKITSTIGSGGMGEVFVGEDLMLERQVAIKQLRPELASRPDVIERFRSEAVILAKLQGSCWIPGSYRPCIGLKLLI